ncbi:transglycosylase SLT domain-containing protein [bacterium]|nr:transglycosylase SLT domain-containing protein [bacterium]
MHKNGNPRLGWGLWVMIKIGVFSVLGTVLLIYAPWSSTYAGFNGQAGQTLRHDAAKRPEILSTWQTRNFAMMNRKFETARTDFPVEMVKAIAWYESEWRQTDVQGRPLVNGTVVRRAGNKRKTYDVGIMQINEDSHCLDASLWDLEKIKIDPIYNIEAGIRMLEKKREYIRYLRRRKDWLRIEAKYDLANHSELDMTLKAYNGFRRSWIYPEKIYSLILEKPWEKAMVRQMKQGRNTTRYFILRNQGVPLAASRAAEVFLSPSFVAGSVSGYSEGYKMIRILEENK